MAKYKPGPKSKMGGRGTGRTTTPGEPVAGPSTSTSTSTSTPRRIVIPMSGGGDAEYDTRSNNLEAFLRTRQAQEGNGNMEASNSKTATVARGTRGGARAVPVVVDLVEQEQNLIAIEEVEEDEAESEESAVVIPDPESSPEIIVYEWITPPKRRVGVMRPASRANHDDADEDDKEDGGEGEELVLGLESTGTHYHSRGHGHSSASSNRNNGSTSSKLPSGNPQVITDRGILARILPRPGPKSRMLLSQTRSPASTPKSSRRSPKAVNQQRSSSGSPASQDDGGSPTKRKRRRKRKLRYTLTKEDFKEAAEALAKALSEDSDEDNEKEGFTTSIAAHEYDNEIKKPVISSTNAHAKLNTNTPKPKPQANTPASTKSKTESNDVQEEEERVMVELCDTTQSAVPITIKISKSSLDFLHRPRTPPEEKQKSARAASSTCSNSSRSDAAVRAWATRNRNRALATSKIYKRLMSTQGRCQVKLFDVGFIGPRVSSQKFGPLMKELGNVSASSGSGAGFRAESVQVRRLLQRFLKTKTKTLTPPPPNRPSTSRVLPLPAPKATHRVSVNPFKPFLDTADFKRYFRQHGLRRVAVRLEDIGTTLGLCPMCDEEIPIGILGRHKAEHTVTCHYPDCDQKIPIGSVMQHGVTHIKGRARGPFTCETCGKVTKTKQMMWCHQNAHFGAKPFICIECGEAFTFESSHRRHVKTVHTKGTPKKVSFSPNLIAGPSSSSRLNSTAATATPMPRRRRDLNPADFCEVVEIND